MKTKQQKAVEFIYIVKQRFQPSKFNEFAKILSEVSNGASVINSDSLFSKLKNMFVDDDHHDLLVALNDFLPRNMITEIEEDPELSSHDDSKYSWLLSDSPNAFFNKIRDRCIEKNDEDFSVLIKFCELIVSLHEKKVTARQVDSEFRYMFDNDPDLYVECTMLLADMWDKSEDEESGSGFGFLNKRRKVVKRRTLYDETMAVKEFYLYEMGLALSRVGSTIEKLEEDPENFEECFSVHDVRCILELYKGSDPDYSCGEEVVEILRYDPVRRIVARRVTLERLRQKQMELQEQKLRLDNVWKEIFEDISEKGVVCRHRGFLEQMTEVSKNNYADSD